jgi:hypothetical protein
MTEIERFIAKTDKGKEYIIILYQEHVHTEDFVGSQDIEGLTQYLTSTGKFVSRIDSETFQIVETNEIVRKV